MILEKTEQTRAPDIAVKSGKTTYLVSFHFANKGKQTMNDKVFKLVLADCAKKPTACIDTVKSVKKTC